MDTESKEKLLAELARINLIEKLPEDSSIILLKVLTLLVKEQNYLALWMLQRISSVKHSTI